MTTKYNTYNVPAQEGDKILPPVCEIYASKTQGHCLDPILRDGDLILVENRYPTKGELGFLYFKDGRNPSVKRVLSPIIIISEMLTQSVQVEQINPPKVYKFSSDILAAAHTVIGTLDAEGNKTDILKGVA